MSTALIYPRHGLSESRCVDSVGANARRLQPLELIEE